MSLAAPRKSGGAEVACNDDDPAGGVVSSRVENFAMLAGVAEETSLKAFYPSGEKAGIARPYVHLNQYRVRLANIYVGRPRLLSNQAFLQVGFDHRKAEKWKNVIYLAGRFLSQAGGWQAAWATVRLQATLLGLCYPCLAQL